MKKKKKRTEIRTPDYIDKLSLIAINYNTNKNEIYGLAIESR